MANQEWSLAQLIAKAEAYCAATEHCISEVKYKLIQWHATPEQIEQIIPHLQKEKFIDELRYSSAFARDKASLAGWGETKIRYMLSSRGIPKEVITLALEEIDGDKAADKLEKLMANKFKSLKDDPQCRMKMLRFALGRGYDYEEVSSVLDKLTGHDNK